MSLNEPLTLDHMELYVTDMEAMRAFYTGVLGFTVTDEGGSEKAPMVFLSRHPGKHHQLVLGTGRPNQLDFNIVNHISFKLGSLSALRALWEQVAKQPHGPIEQANHGISWSIYFRDPEGNRLECFVDTEWYTPQPFRIPLDLRESDEAIRLATEELCRSRPGFSTRERWVGEIASRFADSAHRNHSA